MKNRIRYKLSLCLAISLLVVGCTKELTGDIDSDKNDGFIRIVFASSGFTKADTDLRAPTAGNEDGIQSLELYGFAWGPSYISGGGMAIINIFHIPGKSPINPSEDWGVIKGDTAIVMSTLFRLNDRGENIKYVNLYAIANIAQVTSVDETAFASFKAYNDQITTAVQGYMRKSQPISPDVENKLKNLVVQVSGLSAPLEYPVMVRTMKVEGGASYMQMPLERVYCRIGFSFLFTGNSADQIKINTITIDKTSEQGYLFLEENVSDTPPAGVLRWSAEKEMVSGVFKTAKGAVYTNGEQPTGGTMLTLYANQESKAPLYFRTCQYLCDSEENAPSITLEIVVTSGGKTITRELTAPLYNFEGVGNKKHYGFLRNHSYQVISTINTSTLRLEDVTVETHDWNDRPPVDFPDFK
ncbi:hypothetical protein ACGE0T_02890 [Parabacteroides sp. APC149_11_2_Y6]